MCVPDISCLKCVREVDTNTLIYFLSTEKAPVGGSYNIQVFTGPTEGENAKLSTWMHH